MLTRLGPEDTSGSVPRQAARRVANGIGLGNRLRRSVASLFAAVLCFVVVFTMPVPPTSLPVLTVQVGLFLVGITLVMAAVFGLLGGSGSSTRRSEPLTETSRPNPSPSELLSSLQATPRTW